MISSCSKKSDNTTIAPNSWSFKGKTSTPYTCVLQQFVALPQFNGNLGLAAPTTTSSNDSNYAFMSVIFADTTSVTPGTYTVSADDGIHPPTGSNVFIHLRYGNQANKVIYYATGGSGTAQNLNVSITGSGHLSVNGSGIEMQNQAAGSSSDKANLTFVLTDQ
ncbi:MAG: hypothetical protein JWO03_725 [Bacteroidetes bacterium]|nr:hypothetical protein [Bacteroidota bacterium]